MVDRAAILAEVLRRNRLRVDNHLPPYPDIRAEFEHQVALAADRAFHARLEEYMARHEADRQRIRAEVIEEVREKHGPEAPDTALGHYLVRSQTKLRFYNFLRETYREKVPPLEAKNLVRYGELAPEPAVRKPAPRTGGADVVQMPG